jgi:hypothetical protein
VPEDVQVMVLALQEFQLSEPFGLVITMVANAIFVHKRTNRSRNFFIPRHGWLWNEFTKKKGPINRALFKIIFQ